MKPSASQSPISSTEPTHNTNIEFIPILFFVLGILLAASFV